MAVHAPSNVWTQMNYVPPRGRCNFRVSMLSTCPCLRFMLHPLKSASSYECDGCGHHASFHSMENKSEDDIRKRWENEAKEKQEQEDQKATRPRKRLRELEYNTAADRLGMGRLEEEDLSTLDARVADSAPAGTRSKLKLRKTVSVKSTATRGAARKGNERVTELLEAEEDDCIELD
ncbi:hypothetical protein K491DRAFT_712199 [Lophiostoma macrostomum CBS 122681]|uniref:Uncharacterized protein n=1 Tax=Lophiostoma macrostomum CBS 122681 TaxID=1314788 RepID=A0A6A6TLU6_9PLEO|nr:hypothetical protein K491DRAFT_712199 [Lophiostoma macrostomum CBS 122681]